MKHFLITSLACYALALNARAAEHSGEWTVRSPDGAQQVVVTLAAGQLSYRVDHVHDDETTPVLASSPLGLELLTDTLTRDLQVEDVTKSKTVDESYGMLTGKQLKLRAHYNAFSVTLANPAKLKLAVDFRVFNDGVAFRYRLPKLPKGGAKIIGEATAFRFAHDGKVWMQNFQRIEPWAPAYEDPFTNGTPLGENATNEEGWAFPGLFETAAGWTLLTETDLDGRYFGTHLEAKVTDRTYKIRGPLPATARGIGGVEASVESPWEGPWRIVIHGATLATITESNLVHHLSRPPAKGGDFSWVKPGPRHVELVVRSQQPARLQQDHAVHRPREPVGLGILARRRQLERDEKRQHRAAPRLRQEAQCGPAALV